MRRGRMRTGRIAAGVMLAVALSACGTAGAAGESIVGKGTLVIGVVEGPAGPGPAQAERHASRASTSTSPATSPRTWRTSRRRSSSRSCQYSDRESAIQTGKVDLVVFSYSITPERKTKIAFAGPYYVAHQDTLVRSSDTGIKNVRDLAGRRLCAVNGSVSWQRVTVERNVQAHLVRAASYGDCLRS